MREHHFAGGSFVDVVVVGITRADWLAINTISCCQMQDAQRSGTGRVRRPNTQGGRRLLLPNKMRYKKTPLLQRHGRGTCGDYCTDFFE